MTRLPQPGSDAGTWGQVLNDYLSVIHKTDGTLKDNAVTNSALAPQAIDATVIADSSIPESKLDSTVQAKLNVGSGGTIADASSTIKGIVQLTGDLGGTATSPTVPGLAGKANTSHTHAIADTTGLQTALDGKQAVGSYAATIHTHTASQISDSTATGRSVLTASDAAVARTAIGAGTSNLALGSTGSTAKAGDYTPTWTEVTSKPATFTPSAHTHSIADTTGLQTAIDAKADQSSTYTKTEVDTGLSGKAATSHTHSASDINTGTIGLDRIPVAIPIDEFQLSNGTWPSTTAGPTRRVNWIGYPANTTPPATTGRPAAVAGLDSYVQRAS